MVNFAYPIFGAEILCPHCQQRIAALTLTDAYLCHRHGAFEANSQTGELVHVQSGQRWRLWQERWYRQHTHPDGLRFEIHEELNRLRPLGLRATEIVIADRYQALLTPFLERQAPRTGQWHIYGLPIEFRDPQSTHDPQRWQVINFELTQESDPSLKQSWARWRER